MLPYSQRVFVKDAFLCQHSFEHNHVTRLNPVTGRSKVRLRQADSANFRSLGLSMMTAWSSRVPGPNCAPHRLDPTESSPPRSDILPIWPCCRLHQHCRSLPDHLRGAVPVYHTDYRGAFPSMEKLHRPLGNPQIELERYECDANQLNQGFVV